MRLAAASLIALTCLAPAAMAQSPEPAPLPPPAVAAPISPAPPPAVSPPAVSPPAAAPATPTPTTTPVPDTSAAAAAPAEAPPPAPPSPPTDPAAIRLLATLETVCIPAANGQALAGLAKTAGYRKSGDNFVLKQPGYQFTILPQGSNPNQCHVDIVGPVDPESPGKPLVIALHNWAVFGHNWTLYRNDKNVSGASEFTTRSWENNAAGGGGEALVLTTIRKADGSPSRGAGDTSEMIYSVTKTAG